MMRFTELYQTFFRTKLFNKIVFIYSLITVMAFVTLAIMIYQYSMHSLLQKELNVQTEAVDNVNRYLEQKMDEAQDIVIQLYRDQTLSADLLDFLRNDLPFYVQHRIDEYLLKNTFNDRDVDTFFKRQIDNNEEILNIALYSPDKSFLYYYQHNRTQHYSDLLDNKLAINQTIDGMRLQKKASPRTPQLDQLIGIEEPGAYTFTFEINDPNTLQYVGAIMVTYQPKRIEHVLETRGQRLKGTYLVLFPNGQVIYDSSSRFTGQWYPYTQALLSTKGSAKLDVKSYKTIALTNKSDLIASGILPFSELRDSYLGFKRRIIIITSGCILFTIIFAYIAVFRYSKRTRVIIQAMKRAQQGNLTVRIPVREDDELDEISLGFNRMLEDLTRYINQVYVSEIKQKHAELVALQAQINPHFLYNTLEAIRMRAIAQGAMDVGEMTYILGSLFRYTINQETVVTLDEEIENCRRFLELYRIRYKDKIDYHITVDENIKRTSILKLTIQPLIENIIVHGIRQKSGSANIISIRAFLEQDHSSLIIEITDNGKGIEPGKLEAIQVMFSHADMHNASSSLGLRNVHERIRLLYGEAYGLTIDSQLQEGTVVCIRIPFQKEG